MAGYNLDEKGGLFGMGGIKSASKLLKKDDVAEIRHYSTFDLLNAKLIDVGESTIKVQIKDGIEPGNFKTGEHVVAGFAVSQDKYISNCIINSSNNQLPLELTLQVSKIEKLKDVKKSEKCYVCMNSDLKIIGVPDNKPAVVKQLSINSIKLDCKEDIMMEDIIDGNIKLDKLNKFSFKGKIARKNKINDSIEYGIEIIELVESSSKALHRFVNQQINA